jgi:hypothetical protein
MSGCSVGIPWMEKAVPNGRAPKLQNQPDPRGINSSEDGAPRKEGRAGDRQAHG